MFIKPTMKKILMMVFLILLFFLTSPVLVMAEGLLDVYHLARENDPVYSAAMAAHDAENEVLDQGLSRLLPNVSGSWKYSWNDSSSPSYGSYNKNIAALNVTQPIFDLESFAWYRQSKAQARMGDARFSMVEQKLGSRACQAYFDFLSVWDDLSLIVSRIERLSKQLTQIRRLYDAGEGTLTDVHDVESRLAMARAQRLQAENMLEITRNALKRLTGKKIEDVKGLASDIPLEPPVPADIDQWIDMARERNPGVLYNIYEEEYYDREVDKYRAGHFPSISAGYDLSYSKNDEYYSRSDEIRMSSVSIRVQLPVFSGGWTSSKVREAADRRLEAKHKIEAAQREVSYNVTNAYFTVIDAISRINALEVAVKSSELAFDSNVKGYDAGIRTVVNVLDAQDQLFVARRDLATARYDYVRAILDLKVASGILEESDIVTLDSWLAD